MPLEKEIATLNRLRAQLAPQSGKWALIKGESLIAVLDTYSDAMTMGYDKFKLDPFMVAQINDTAARAAQCLTSP